MGLRANNLPLFNDDKTHEVIYAWIKVKLQRSSPLTHAYQINNNIDNEAHKHVCKYGDKTCNKHKSKSFSPNCNIKTYMHKPKILLNMHITHKFFSPFLSIINKGFKVKSNQTNFSPPFCQKQRDQEGIIQINQ